MENLPSLRFITKPDWGLGIDAKLRFGFGFNCFMSAESYLNGSSHVGFGLEPRKAPWVRVQFTPTVKLIIRMPLARVSEFKFLYVGAEGTLFDKGTHPRPELSSPKAFWGSVRRFIQPSLEMQHHNTLLGTLFDDRQRRLLKEAFREVSERRKTEMERVQSNRDRVMSTFDPPELPPLDPRRGPSDLRMRLHEMNKRRQPYFPEISPTLLDDLRDRGIQLPDRIPAKNGSQDETRDDNGMQSRVGQTARLREAFVLAEYSYGRLRKR